MPIAKARHIDVNGIGRSLDRMTLFDSQVLAIDAKVGELTGPDDDRALIVLADTRRQRAVAEVDEFDVLNIRLGQRCQISADAASGVLASESHEIDAPLWIE